MKMTEEDEASTEDELDELDEHLSLLLRKFSKLKLQRNFAGPKSFRKVSKQNKILSIYKNSNATTGVVSSHTS